MSTATLGSQSVSEPSTYGTRPDGGRISERHQRYLNDWQKFASQRDEKSKSVGTRSLTKADADEPEEQMPSISPPREPLDRDTVVQQRAFQSWECEILADEGGSVRVSMRDITDASSADEFADMDPEELLHIVDDRRGLSPGTVFYWTIGEERLRGGTYRKFSEMRLKRYPKASSRSVRERLSMAKDDAEFMRTTLGQ